MQKVKNVLLPPVPLIMIRLTCRRLFGSGQLAGSNQPPPVLRAPGGDQCPGEWPRWRPRGESAPLSASTGNGRHRGGSDNMGVCTMEDERNWFVGVDWASETHHVRVSDARGRKLGARAFAHSGEGLAAMAAWILAVTGAAPEAVFVAIEVPHGPVVESLMERGFRVHAINPKQLDRFRDRFSPAGAKD